MLKISKIFLSHPSSLSTSLTFTLFFQHSPQQSPHAGTHYNPLLKHEYNRMKQGFFEDSLHLQRINWRGFSGAVSKSIFTGSKPVNIQELLLRYLQVDTQSMEENRSFGWR